MRAGGEAGEGGVVGGGGVAPACHAPPGYRLLRINEGFTRHNGPFYVRTGEDFALGFRVLPIHCNITGVCHGGLLAAALDLFLPVAARLTVDELADRVLLTVSLSIDYLGGAACDAWVDAHVDVLRRTGRMVFTQGLLFVDGQAIARGSGVFKIGPVDDRLPFGV